MAEHGGGGGCCRCCISFILTSGLTALFMWLSLRTSDPHCSIQTFYVPALNLSNPDNSTNTSIAFDLKLDNPMKDKGVRYSNLTLSFLFYNSTSISPLLPVANYTVRGFYQGHKKNTHRKDTVDAAGLPWAAAVDAAANGTVVKFRVEVATRVKFKILFWYTKRKRLQVGGDVAVNASGGKVNRKNVKLKSSGAGGLVNAAVVVLGFIFHFILVI